MMKNISLAGVLSMHILLASAMQPNCEWLERQIASIIFAIPPVCIIEKNIGNLEGGKGNVISTAPQQAMVPEEKKLPSPLPAADKNDLASSYRIKEFKIERCSAQQQAQLEKDFSGISRRQRVEYLDSILSSTNTDEDQNLQRIGSLCCSLGGFFEISSFIARLQDAVKKDSKKTVKLLLLYAPKESKVNSPYSACPISPKEHIGLFLASIARHHNDPAGMVELIDKNWNPSEKVLPEMPEICGVALWKTLNPNSKVNDFCAYLEERLTKKKAISAILEKSEKL